MSDSTSLSIQENQALSEPQRVFCGLIADCMTIKEARERLGWTGDLYRKMRADQPAFDRAVTLAREMAQDEHVDKLLEIVETEPDPHRARLKVDTIKWIAGKIKARVYGDKLDVTVEHRVDIGDALATARARATLRPSCDPVDVIDAQFEALPNVVPTRAIDNESPAPPAQALPDIFG